MRFIGPRYFMLLVLLLLGIVLPYYENVVADLLRCILLLGVSIADIVVGVDVGVTDASIVAIVVATTFANIVVF